MKSSSVSVKIRDADGRLQKPLVACKFPFEISGFSARAAFKVCGPIIQELSLRLSSDGPSLELCYRPTDPDQPLALSIKSGFHSPWSSFLTLGVALNLSHPSHPRFLLRLKPLFGNFSIRHEFGPGIHDEHRQKIWPADVDDDHQDPAGSPVSGSSPSSNVSFVNAFATHATRQDSPDNAASSSVSRGARQHMEEMLYYDHGRNVRLDASSNVSFPSFDSTPKASQETGFERLDDDLAIGRAAMRQLSRNRSSYNNPHWVSQTSYQRMSMDADGESWRQVTDGRDKTKRSMLTGGQSQLQEGRCKHLPLQGNQYLRLCTNFPLAAEGNCRVRWSVCTSVSSSRFFSLPVLLLDKVSVQAPRFSSMGAPRHHRFRDNAETEEVPSPQTSTSKSSSLRPGQQGEGGVKLSHFLTQFLCKSLPK